MAQDRELLELAARAAGRAYHWDGDVLVLDDPAPAECSAWNPRIDDGDCARLEAALGLHIAFDLDRVTVVQYDAERAISGTLLRAVELYADHSGDKQAARRMATLRCAAEIGKAMKEKT